jgi:general secretion pathway protein C
MTAPLQEHPPVAPRAVARPSSTTSSTEGEAKAKTVLTREKLQRGLQHLGDGVYSLSRDLLLEALRNPGGATAGAYFMPSEDKGRTVGMEVRAVRDGSPLSQLGIRTGDVVRSINGIDVSTPLGLLDALRTARETDSIAISIVREGAERGLRYMITQSP